MIPIPNISVITPAFNESSNLPVLYERLCRALQQNLWEWIIIDDHSEDDTFSIIQQIASNDRKVSGLRLARNGGPHAAAVAGLPLARGQSIVFLSADLQDPPELISRMIEWQQAVPIVWAAREHREGITGPTLFFSRCYYWLLRELLGIKQLPSQGSDFFIFDQSIAHQLIQLPQSCINLSASIAQQGWPSRSINYTKQLRQHGRSGWSLRKKIKLFLTSSILFSPLPLPEQWKWFLATGRTTGQFPIEKRTHPGFFS